MTYPDPLVEYTRDAARRTARGQPVLPFAPPLSPLKPTGVIDLDVARLAVGPDGRPAFNPSLLVYKGRRLLAYRAGFVRTRIHVAELDEGFNVVSTTGPLELGHPRAAVGQEDPRLFDAGGRLGLHYCGVESVRGLGRTSQMVAFLADDLTVASVHYPEMLNGGGRREPKEKNWSPFWHDGEHLAVYSTGPHHEVVRIEGDQAHKAHMTPAPFPWSGGFLRGGCPPVRVGDHYYHFFHGRVGSDDKPWYNVGLSVFEAKPPFRVVAQTADPLAWGDREANRTVDKNYACTLYPGGAALLGGEWVVACGVNDYRIQLWKWSAAELAGWLAGELLKPSPEPPLPPPPPQERGGRGVRAGVRQLTTGGPGTELKKLLMDLGLAPAAGCECESRAAQMDVWGVPGCETNRPTIVGWLREESRKAGWAATIKAVVASVKQGLFLSPTDPAGSLLDEALRRVKEKPDA